MRKKIFIIFFAVLGSIFSTTLWANNAMSASNKSINQETPQFIGHLNIESDTMLNHMLNWHIKENKSNNSFRGYRVQIFFGAGIGAKDMAYKTKSQFLSSFSETRAYVVYQSPDFKVRVGDFRTQSEALKFKETIKSKYPSAFIVSDNIVFPDLE